ncbi:MAG: hypothetical protein H6559_21475 [Lewinellaceae bacterium]|nr:hypothetical protein [Lewinellaceae bacterium]
MPISLVRCSAAKADIPNIPQAGDKDSDQGECGDDAGQCLLRLVHPGDVGIEEGGVEGQVPGTAAVQSAFAFSRKSG